MKKTIIFLFLISITFLSFSQDVSNLGIVGKYYDIKSDNNGTIHILWKDNGWAKYGQIVNKQVVNQITIPGLANNEVDHVKFRPRIAVKPDGTEIHIIWVANSQSLVHAWKNSSGTWAKTTIHSSATNRFVVYPSVTVDSAGVVHAAVTEWTQGVYNYPVLYFRKAVGSSWVKQSNLTPTDAQYRWSTMFTDSSGNVHITWDRNKALIQYRTAPSGGNLANSSTITLPAYYDRNKESDVYVDTLGNVHVAALSYNDPGISVGIDYWSKTGGSGFNASLHANASQFLLDGGYHPYPAVIANSPEMVAVAWGDGLAPTTVTAAIYNGTGWTRYIMDTDADFKTDTRPSMALNSTTAFLVWRSVSGSISLATFDFASFGVFSPSGGEEWGFGKTYEIKWNLESATGNVDINLFKNNINLGPVVSDIADSGTYSWTIDTLESGTGIVSGTDYQIQVIAVNDSDNAMSNGNFSILPSIDITAPTAGLKWNMGSTNEITWTKTGTQNDFVNITLFKGGSAVLNIATSASNSGSYFWDIPGTITPGVDYTISVDTVDGEVTDESEVFSILGSINVTSPSSGVEWLYGNTYSITWEVYGTMNASVKIRLQQSGANIVAITDSTPNDGSYTWTVPATVPSATNYVMMVKTIDSVVYDTSDEFTIAAESSGAALTVTSPVSSSNWTSGSTQAITWNKTGTQHANVKIELFKGGSLNTTISSSELNDGSFSWTIGTAQPTGSDYMVRITTLDDQVTDDSDNFTITYDVVTPEITVTSPSTGANWYRGSAYTIAWNTAGSMDTSVKIELIKGGALNATIAPSTENDGSFSWTIDSGQAIGTDYVVRITTIDSAVTDDSGQFSISDQPAFGITVTSPSGSSQWIHGNTYTITWDKAGTMNASVKIRLQQNGANIVAITNLTPNDGSYSWRVPATIPSASNYTIMVKTIDSLVFDTSDLFYVGATVVTPTLTVTSPVSSSNWNSGTTQTITWNRTGTQDANVKIELFKGGSLDTTISSSTLNDGSYSWTISGSQTTGSDYVVRITTLNNALTDDSDVFTITLEVVTPTLTITSPTSSSNWLIGSTQSITWNKAGTQDANVKIDLYKGGTLDSAIIGSTPNSGSYSWPISASQAAGTDYVIKITTIDNALTDDSDQFTISEEPAFGITVTSPSGSSQWIYGNTYTITWNKAGTMNSFVKLRLQQNGANIVTITNMTANDGSYSWTVPATVPSASNYTIMVKTIDSQVYDASDQFYIGTEVINPTITITNPISSSYWISGSTYAITWNTTGTQDTNVKINLYKGGSLDSAIIGSTPNSGSYSWTIDGAQTPGTDYVVRVTTIDDQVTDDSEQFTISDTAPAATINITSPTGNSEWNAGSNVNITWDTTGSQDPNVNIYLYNNGNFHSNIVMSTPNDGSYSWSLSSGLSSSNRYMVRVETVDAQITDDSNLFKIFGTGITIDMPEAGDTLTKGSNVNITWKKVGSQNSYVKIRLQQNGANIVTLTDRTANDGSFTWTVPATLTNNDNYYFMVKTVDNQIYDTSSNLRVANAGILVNSPSTNNVLKRGSQYSINWTKTGAQNGTVKLRVLQGGVQILSITDSTTNDGSFTWTVPGDISTGNNLVIRVKTTDDLVSDDSGLFTIED